MKNSRKDCFFGLHFDFHAQKNTVDIGKDFDEAELAALLDRVKPDFVQCDTKGHPGISSYPTKVGTPAPDIRRDILAAWRKVTRAYGVRLYAHHSALWEDEAATKHPDWAVVDANGDHSAKYISLFGPYDDALLIPQLLELARDYDLDGAWVDGECWAAYPDYSEHARTAWRAAGGGDIPSEGSEEWEAYLDFCRDRFFAHVSHYIAEVKKVYPNFELTSNWLNSSFAPTDLAVTDFISGDIAATDCAYRARYEARMMANNDRPWDLMAWGTRRETRVLKSSLQLCQELAAVMAMGGGVQIYYFQSPERLIVDYPAVLRIAGEVSDFCRARRDFCHGAQPLPVIGVACSLAAFYHKRSRLFTPGHYMGGVRGLTDAVLDGGYPAEILKTTTLTAEKLRAYDAFLVPNAPVIDEEARAALLDYARAGGTLILSGADTALCFAAELGVPAEKHTNADGYCLKIERGELCEAYLTNHYATFAGDVLPVCTMRMATDGSFLEDERDTATFFGEGERIPAGVSVPLGKGKVILLAFDLGDVYRKQRSYLVRSVLSDLLAPCSVRLRGYGSSLLSVSLLEKDGKEYIHLLNMGGQAAAGVVQAFDEIPPLTDLRVEYRAPRTPVRATLQPAGKPLTFTVAGNKLVFAVDRLELHDCIELEYEKE